MKNWAGNIDFRPESVSAPSSVAELRSFVKRADDAKQTLRPRGSGHSWTGLIETQEISLRLDRLRGILEIDRDRHTIRALAGTKLAAVAAEAFENGLALENQGDIDRQSLAGATSTGTHGTGLSLRSMANQVTALSLITAGGETVTIDEASEPDLFQAARVALGALGIISEITLQLVPAYRLKVTTFAEDMKAAMQAARRRLADHRHFEMLYFPVGDWSIVKIMDRTPDPVTRGGFSTQVNDVVLENWLYGMLNAVAARTGAYPWADHLMRRVLSRRETVDWAHRAFPSARNVKFMEMEYSLPIEHFEAAFREVQQAINAGGFRTLFPIQIRFVRGDPIWLSPAHGRDSVYFAVHTYYKESYIRYFELVEKIFQEHGGRPHWGKWHSMTPEQFRESYPRWDDFLRVREALDPRGRFLNDYLKRLFGTRSAGNAAPRGLRSSPVN